MALVTRMSRLFTADLHAVLDRLEEPDVLLKQAIREMEDDIALREQRIRWLDHKREEAIRHCAQIDDEIAEIAAQLDVCFESDAEQLVRTLLKRRLESEQLAKRLRSRADANAEALAAEHVQLEEHRQSFDAMRQKAELLLDEANRSTGSRVPMTHHIAVTDADVEVALLQEKLRRSRP